MIVNWHLRFLALALCVVLFRPLPALAGPPALPSNTDASLALPPSVVAWGGFSSLNSLFEMMAAAGPQLGLTTAEDGPPGAKLWTQAEKAAKPMGITTLAWLRRDQPIRFFLQDEGGAPGIAAGVLLLPMTNQGDVLQAFGGAQLGAEGHAAVFSPPDMDLRLFLDFLPNQVAVTFETARWQRASAVAAGPLGNAPVPGLFSVGVGLANLVALRPKELQKLKDAVNDPQKLPKKLQAGSASYATAFKQIVEELDTFELVLGGDKDSLQLGFRVRGRPNTALYRSLHAGDGRSVAELARLLPGTSYLAGASHMDPQPALAQLSANFAMLDTALKLPKGQKAKLLAQFTALAQGLTGQTALALYPDGDAALGMLALVGAKEPLSFRLAAARLAGQVALLLMDQQAKKNAADKPKKAKDPEKAKLEAVARKGLAQGTLRPLIQAIQPKAEKAGVLIVQTESSAGGLACDAIAITIDWAKVDAASDAPSPIGPALLGKGLTLAACSTAQLAILAIGPGALDHARRVADNRPGGLAEQPGYRAALAHAVPQPSSLMLFDSTKALATFQTLLTDAAKRANWLEALAGALPMSASYGILATAGEYRLDLPLSFLAAARRAFKLVAEGDRDPEPAAVAPSPLPSGDGEAPFEESGGVPEPKVQPR